MTTIMIHRALPTRTGQLIRPGEYGVKRNPAQNYLAVYTLGKPNILLTSMTFEQYASAELAGWLTEICSPDANPFARQGEITIGNGRLIARNNQGAIIESRTL